MQEAHDDRDRLCRSLGALVWANRECDVDPVGQLAPGALVSLVTLVAEEGDLEGQSWCYVVSAGPCGWVLAWGLATLAGG